jgi:hypothetical protein
LETYCFCTVSYYYYYYYEHMSKSLTSLISETAKGISTRLCIYIK